ncbi:hypothetical protein C0557_10875 [Kosakonia sp. MUSA4]|nr:hypothetical protein C0557_10875 [Kosakonia sp. MUSA4]
MADRLYATSHFTDLYFNCRIYDSWQVLNFTYFCFSLIRGNHTQISHIVGDLSMNKSPWNK